MRIKQPGNVNAQFPLRLDRGEGQGEVSKIGFVWDKKRGIDSHEATKARHDSQLKTTG
jgi:hypothetical protein